MCVTLLKDWLAQNRPVNIGAQVFAANRCYGCPLDIRASLGRHLAFAMGPLRDQDGRHLDRGCKLSSSPALLVDVIEKFHKRILSDSLNQFKHFAPSKVKRFAL